MQKLFFLFTITGLFVSIQASNEYRSSLESLSQDGSIFSKILAYIEPVFSHIKELFLSIFKVLSYSNNKDSDSENTEESTYFNVLSTLDNSNGFDHISCTDQLPKLPKSDANSFDHQKISLQALPITKAPSEIHPPNNGDDNHASTSSTPRQDGSSNLAKNDESTSSDDDIFHDCLSETPLALSGLNEQTA